MNGNQSVLNRFSTSGLTRRGLVLDNLPRFRLGNIIKNQASLGLNHQLKTSSPHIDSLSKLAGTTMQKSLLYECWFGLDVSRANTLLVSIVTLNRAVTNYSSQRNTLDHQDLSLLRRNVTTIQALNSADAKQLSFNQLCTRRNIM